MKIRNITFAASALILGLGAVLAPSKIKAQSPNETLNVNLPYSVTIGNKILQPGSYTIQELESPVGSPVLQIFGDNGMKLETSAMAVSRLESTQADTRVTLHHIGSNYYFDKIWIGGNGFQFPLPKDVNDR